MDQRRFSWLDLALFAVSLVAIVLSVVVLLGSGPIRNFFSGGCDGETGNDAVLHEGDTWCGGGLALTADNFCVEECGDDIEVTFTLENISETDIIVPVSHEDFVVVVGDEASNNLGLLQVLPGPPNEPVGIMNLSEGESKEWTFLFTYTAPDSPTPASLPEQATDFWVGVKQIGSRIEDAQWWDKLP